MARRLTLSTVGIDSPLSVGETPPPQPAPDEQPEQASHAEQAEATKEASAPRPRRRPRSRVSSVDATPTGVATLPRERGDGAFYGTGRPLETAMALNPTHLERLGELSRAASRSINAITVAALQAGLPGSTDAAGEAIVAEQRGRVGALDRRVRTTMRLPDDLRARIDELSVPALRLSRGARADLINAALERGLPADPYAAAALVDGHARRLLDARAAA
jgi:predicted transcriptional regulator